MGAYLRKLIISSTSNTPSFGNGGIKELNRKTTQSDYFTSTSNCKYLKLHVHYTNYTNMIIIHVYVMYIGKCVCIRHLANERISYTSLGERVVS